MSVMVVNDRAYNVVAKVVLDHERSGNGWACEDADDLRATAEWANLVAYSVRYGETFPVFEHCRYSPVQPTTAQAYKTCKCWLYNTDEGADNADVAAIRKRVETALASLADELISTHPEYVAAVWG